MQKENYTPHPEQLLYHIPDSIIQDFGLEDFRESTIVGGAARSVALKYLFGLDTHISDIDVALIDNLEAETDKIPTEGHDPESAKGHVSLEEYFEQVDFTVNQLCLRDGKIYMTDACLQAMRDRRVQVAPAELLSDDPRSLSRQIARGLLLQVTLTEQTKEAWTFINPINPESDFYVGLFEIAVCLDKAIMRGDKVAMEYLKLINRPGMLPESDYSVYLAETDGDQLLAAKAYIVNNLYEFSFRRSAAKLSARLLDLSLGDAEEPPIRAKSLRKTYKNGPTTTNTKSKNKK